MNPLEALAAEYRRELPRKLERLAAALHSLMGSAGTFGLPEVSAAARKAEAYLSAHGGALDVAKFRILFDAVRASILKP